MPDNGSLNLFRTFFGGEKIDLRKSTIGLIVVIDFAKTISLLLCRLYSSLSQARTHLG